MTGMLPPLLTSPVIPVPFRHGFTTRAGGVSGAPFASLNLGMKWGDARENVLENRRRLLVASGARAIYLAAQVHGARVVVVRAGDEPQDIARQEADGVCANLEGVAAGIYVADCVPALFADPRTGAFAAVHAGWRGTVAGVLPAAVTALGEAFGSRPEDLRVALGPSIASCCFEVGPEVAATFAAAWPGAGVVIERPSRKPHVHLRLAQRLQLLAAGLPAEAIDSGEDCTKCDPGGRFYSYRRDAGQTGQHVGFIGR
jgi:YfiH family protein